MRNRRASWALVVLAVIFLLGLTLRVFATTPVTVQVTTPNPTVGQKIFFSGTTAPNAIGDTNLYVGSVCTGTATDDSGTWIANGAGAYMASFVATDHPTPGMYSIQSEGPTGTFSPCVTFTVDPAPPIPEYPLGLLILAVLMILAYGVIRRRTRK
jgi:hypothetical protein